MRQSHEQSIVRARDESMHRTTRITCHTGCEMRRSALADAGVARETRGTMRYMRKLGVVLFAVGILTAVGSVLHARSETQRRYEQWYSAEMGSNDLSRLNRLVSMLRERTVPTWIVVDPMPGVYVGIGIALTGMIIFAMPTSR